MRMTDKGTLYIVSAPSGAGKTSLVAALVVSLLWLVVAFHLRGQWMFALLFLVLGASLAVVFGKRELMSHRYVFPALAGMGVFVIFPLLYTVGISFSNYSSSNLLSEEIAGSIVE